VRLRYLRGRRHSTPTLSAAALAGCATLRRIIHVSSVSVYARPAPGRWEIPETAETVDPQDSGAESYARSKKAAELALNTVVGDRSGIFVSHLRASSIYGRGMSRTTLLPVLVGKALRGEDMLLGGPRNYRQNFIHVDDVAALALALLGHDSPAHLMNAFSDDTLEVGALAQMIRNQLGSKSRIVDQTDASEIPTPVFVNDLAKSLHPVFRPLADNLRDAE
jgi:nucleoside-diphosphate-sugar epimerase